MTTTYRMAIEVQAWRVASDGSLPEEERAAMQDRVVNLRRVQGSFPTRRWRYESPWLTSFARMIPNGPIRSDPTTTGTGGERSLGASVRLLGIGS